MSITFSGLASGLPVNDIIDQLMALERRPLDNLEAKKSGLEASRSYVDNIEARVKTLSTSIQKFADGNLTSSMDLFKAKTAKSANDSILTATAGANAVNQTLEVNILQIASATKVSSLGSAAPTGNVGNLIQGTTDINDLSNGAGTAGTMTVFYNGNPYEITINDTDTVNDVLVNISGIGGGGLITGSVAGGVVTLASTGGGTIDVGANGDTSNFASATQLDIGTYVGNDLISTNSISAINTSGTLTDNSANLQVGVTAGTVTIGSDTFTIDATTTMDSLIRDINNSATAKVSASYNLRTNKIDFVSKEPGSVAITLGAAGDTSNFLTAANMVNGADTLAYQTLGNNAQIQINGGPIIESTSNNVTDAVTGIKDVTLNLQADSAGSSITVTIQNDTDALTDAISKFVADYNTVISYIDEQTNPKTGKLPSDNNLVRLRNNLRSMVTDLVSNSPLYSVASAGITTGKAGKEGDATSKLVFEKSVFIEALQTSPDDIRALFIGDTAASITGVMQKLDTFVDASLDIENGFFASREQSINNQISDIEKSILRAQDRLDSKEKLLKAQYAAMEAAISKMNSQSAYMGGQMSSM